MILNRNYIETMLKALSSINANTKVVVSKFSEESLSKKFIKYGLFPTKLITVMNKFNNGSLVIGDSNFKLALDAITASKIIVSEI